MSSKVLLAIVLVLIVAVLFAMVLFKDRLIGGYHVLYGTKCLQWRTGGWLLVGPGDGDVAHFADCKQMVDAKTGLALSVPINSFSGRVSVGVKDPAWSTLVYDGDGRLLLAEDPRYLVHVVTDRAVVEPRLIADSRFTLVPVLY